MIARRDPIVAALVGGAAFALYRATLAPGLAHLGSGDGQELTLVAANLGLAHPTGYPLYTWVGFVFTRLWPFGEIAHRTNLLSAVLGAAGVAMLFAVGRRLGFGVLAAAFSALLLAVSTTFWSQAVVTEVYAPNVLALTATLWLALRWADAVERGGSPRATDRRFVAFALAFGLAPGAHLSNLGFAPSYALFALLVDPRILGRPRTVAAALAAFALGAAQFAWLPFRAGAWDVFPNLPPASLARFWEYTLGAFTNLRFAYPLSEAPTRIATYLDLLARDVGWPAIPLGLAGLWILRRRDPKRSLLLAGMYATHVVFFSQQIVLDPEVFFVASTALFALFVGVAVDAIHGLAVRATALPRPAVTAAVGALALVPIVALGASGLRVNDRSTDTATHDFYDTVFETLPPGAVLMARGRGAYGAAVNYHHRYRNVRPDVVVATEHGARMPPPDAPRFVAQWHPPLGVPPSLLPPDPRYAPVLRGAQHELVLYRADAGAGPAPAPAAMPRTRIDRDLGGAVLVAYDVDVARRRRPARVRLLTAWRTPEGDRAPIVLTRVGGLTLEAHELRGERPDGALGDAEGRGLLVEEIDLVLPSHLPPGTHALSLGVAELGPAGVALRWAPLGPVDIE